MSAGNPSEGLWKIDSVLNRGAINPAPALVFSNQHSLSFYGGSQDQRLSQPLKKDCSGRKDNRADILQLGEQDLSRASEEGQSSECAPEAKEGETQAEPDSALAHGGYLTLPSSRVWGRVAPRGARV